MKKIFFVLFTLFIMHMGCFSQNFSRLTEIINAPAITNEQAAYFIGTYIGTVSETDSTSNAFEKMKSAGYFKEDSEADTEMKLSELCSLYAKVSDVKGGLMFILTKKSGRYAFREFKAKGWLPKNADPSLKVSGANAVSLFNSVTGAAK